MRQLLRLAWRNMWRNWRRTAIALVAIALGLGLLIFMDGLMSGGDQAIFGNAVRFYGGNIQVHAPGYRDRAARLPLLPMADADAVVATALRAEHVITASRRISTGGLVSTSEGSHAVAIVAIEPSRESTSSIVAENVVSGRFLLDEDEGAVLVGRGLADLLAVSVGDRLTLVGRARGEAMRQHTMTVVGIFDLGMREAERALVYIPLQQAQVLYGLRGQATEVIVNLERVGQEPQVVAGLQSALPGYEVDSWETLKPELRSTLDMKMAFTSAIGLIVVFIACIGILNLLLMAVFERTREMGVLAALGMKGRQLMILFLLEGGLMGAVGAVLGCALGLALVGYVGHVGFDLSFASGMGEITALMGERLYPRANPTQVVQRAIIVTVIATVASFYPAWQASRRQPAEILHHV